MNNLKAAESDFLFEEELMDFDFDVAGEPEDFEAVLSSVTSSSSSAGDLAASLCRALTDGSSIGEIVEEELEWLSNKDAFPPIESCLGILSDNPGLITSHRSPVSVLEASNAASNFNPKGSAVVSCCGGGLKVPSNPGRHRSTGRRKPRTSFEFPDIENKRGSSFLLPPPPPPSATKSMGRSCLHCGSEKTPQWRAGPMGPKTLCNACGVRYKSGRLLPEYRPASSPTFSSSLHSNSHRRVVEMRKQKQQLAE